jgi:ADP-heptose:LPS heptosyltransferase
MSRQRILIFRGDNIGDLVLFSGALERIRELHPDAHITVALKEPLVGLMECCPFVDCCVPITSLTWWGDLERRGFWLENQLKRVVLALNRWWNARRHPFEVVISPMKSPGPNHLELVYCLNAPQNFGVTGCRLNAPAAGFPKMLRPDRLFSNSLDVAGKDPWRHELLFTADFLRLLGCRPMGPDDIRPGFWFSDPECSPLDAVRRPGRKIVGLFPGASAAIRRWPPENYGELARLLAGAPVFVIFGSAGDRQLAEAVAASLRTGRPGAEVVNLAGATTVRELAESISRCDLLISTETSGLHMAIAAGVPSVGIVGGGHFGRFVPWGDPARHLFLTNRLDCFHCNWSCTRNEPECITRVTPGAVAQAAQSLEAGE